MSINKIFDKFFFRLWMRYRLWRIVRPVLSAREPDSWVFITGCYNSGTTLLREVLGAHPEISCLPREGVRLTDSFPDLEQNGWMRMWHRNAHLSDLQAYDAETVAKVAKRDWSIWWHRNSKVFLEKSIVHGAWMPFLQKGFKNAKFIVVIRNGYCASEGIRRRAHPVGAAREVVGKDLYTFDQVGQQWVYANEKIQTDKSKIEHYLEIRYEDLVNEPEETIRAIFKFIGVSSEYVRLSGNDNIGVGKHSFQISNQNASSLGRLSPENREELHKVIGPTMEKLGYEPTGENM